MANFHLLVFKQTLNCYSSLFICNTRFTITCSLYFPKLTLISALHWKLSFYFTLPKDPVVLLIQLPCLPHLSFHSFIFHFYPQLSHNHLKLFHFLWCFCLQPAGTEGNIWQELSHSKTGKKTTQFLLKGTAVTKGI